MAAIAILGANGRTGRILVRQGLIRGHRVTAVTRGSNDLRSGDLPAHSAGLSTVVGDVTDPRSLTEVLHGHDAVISALGTTGRGPTTLYSASAAALVAALAPDTRLLVISSAGIEVPATAGAGTRLAGRLLHRIMRGTYDDMARMEAELAASELIWTAIRPSRLTDGPATGTPRICLDASDPVGSRTRRADLADYLLNALDDPHTHRRPVAISS
ncbi:NAD(P)H-binding protein [Nocardia sp. NBC_01503]|uniref:NAD(P)-dependent oxidoreductase n=1 Tax=Nocardia sp. NBC_01503 TaxID=2975997 RepID=UPI002E7C189C|nr:NAD(P)H-binding protein [Nocardia sp. NBC_01503]WTL33572.1 NAD(P)H-binding protein [Nocardia sp. NBC_01503]